MTETIASFDIGKKNFAFCVEEFSPAPLRALVVPRRVSDRYSVDGTPTDAFRVVLDRVCAEGNLVLLRNEDLTAGCDAKTYLDQRVFLNLTAVLDQHRAVWDKCSVFLIERQMDFGKARNPMALRLAQHVFSYFSIRYAGFREIVEFPAYHKTRVLGAPKKQTKPQRKKWAVAAATAILTLRGDTDTLQTITAMRKRDDVADVIVQLQAFKVMRFVDTT